MKSAKDNFLYGDSLKQNMADRQGIGHPHYFHRYTQIGVPTGDIADLVIQAFIHELPDGRAGDATAEVGRMLKENAGLVTSKLMKMSDLPAHPLLEFILNHYEATSELKIGFFEPPASRELTQLSEHILLSIPANEALELVQLGCASRAGLTLICETLRRILFRSEDWPNTEVEDWLAEAHSIAAKAIQSSFIKMPSNASDSSKEFVLHNLWALRDFSSNDKEFELQNFVWKLIDSEAHWELEDFLAFLLQESSVGNRHAQWTELRGFDSSSLDNFLGIEKLADVLHLQDSPFKDESPAEPRFEAGASFSEKKRFIREHFPRMLRESQAQQES